jgi:hypothetical protein
LTCLDHSGIVVIKERLDARLVKGVAPTGRVSSSPFGLGGPMTH